MKILQVIYSLSSGGAERFVVDLSNALALEGNEVYLCVFRDDSKSDNLGFYKELVNEKVIYLNLKEAPKLRFSTFYKVYLLLKSLRPDVVHCHLNVIPYFFFPALILKKMKFFHTIHNIANKTVGRWQFPINKYFYKTEKIQPITISQECNKSYLHYYNLSNSKLIPNGRSSLIKTKEYNNVTVEINNLKKTKDTLIFIHIGRYSKQKNQQLLIEAFNNFDREGLDFLLLIIGSDFDSIEGLHLQQIACSKIHFLGPKKNVADYIIQSNVFCLTSIYEGLPISLLEAISVGCIPICTPVGGIIDVIIDGKTGYLSEDITVESYIKAVRRFLNHNSVSNIYLRSYFLENFSMSTCSKKYLEIFNRI